jgi:hypothetical protein
MSRIVIVILIYHRHKPIDLIYDKGDLVMPLSSLSTLQSAAADSDRG